jgi:hypothetical protein
MPADRPTARELAHRFTQCFTGRDHGAITARDAEATERERILRAQLTEFGYREGRPEQCPGCGYDVVDCDKRYADCTGRWSRRALAAAVPRG